MNPDDISRIIAPLIEVLNQTNSTLERIAIALEKQAESPTGSTNARFRRALSEYATFDWASIKAEIVQRDKSGVSIVRWGGNEYIRRNKQLEVWFSRKIGSRPGNNGSEAPIYDRLIEFTQIKPARSVSEEIRELY